MEEETLIGKSNKTQMLYHPFTCLAKGEVLLLKGFCTCWFVGLTQCDQIGLFLKVFATEFLTKVAQIFTNYFGHFEKPSTFT